MKTNTYLPFTVLITLLTCTSCIDMHQYTNSEYDVNRMATLLYIIFVCTLGNRYFTDTYSDCVEDYIPSHPEYRFKRIFSFSLAPVVGLLIANYTEFVEEYIVRYLCGYICSMYIFLALFGKLFERLFLKIIDYWDTIEKLLDCLTWVIIAICGYKFYKCF